VHFAAGSDHTAGIDASGKLWMWGSNKSGRLGDGSTDDKNVPTLIDDNSTWIQVSCGGFHTLAIRSDSTLWAWGSNELGQLGDGSTQDSRIMRMIGADKKWQKVEAGVVNSFAMDDDSILYAWGHNNAGNLGTGDTLDQWLPVELDCPPTQLDEISKRIDFHIRPNMASDVIMIFIDTPPQGQVTYRLISSQGIVLNTGTLSDISKEIRIAHLAPGTYFIQLSTTNKISTKPFVKK
jgi:hypothetical protein